MTEKERTERFVLYMACAIFFICFLYLFLVTFMSIPQSGIEHAKTITGFILGVGISTLISYLWGSSKGSAAKSESIDNKLNGPSAPVVSQTSTFTSTEKVDKTTEVVAKPVVEEVKP
jgi:hypothetical protein